MKIALLITGITGLILYVVGSIIQAFSYNLSNRTYLLAGIRIASLGTIFLMAFSVLVVILFVQFLLSFVG